MSTVYTIRPVVNTNYSLLRLGGAYLMNSLGGYILTKDGNKIIVKVPGGTLNTTIYTTRIPI